MIVLFFRFWFIVSHSMSMRQGVKIHLQKASCKNWNYIRLQFTLYGQLHMPVVRQPSTIRFAGSSSRFNLESQGFLDWMYILLGQLVHLMRFDSDWLLIQPGYQFQFFFESSGWNLFHSGFSWCGIFCYNCKPASLVSWRRHVQG